MLKLESIYMSRSKEGWQGQALKRELAVPGKESTSREAITNVLGEGGLKFLVGVEGSLPLAKKAHQNVTVPYLQLHWNPFYISGSHSVMGHPCADHSDN